MFKAMTPFFPDAWRGQILAAIAGSLISLSLAPYKLWPAAIAAMVLYYISHLHLSPKQAFWRGWAFGAGAFATGVSWVYVSIHLHGNTAVPLAVVFTGFFCLGLAFLFAIPSYVFARYCRDHKFNILAFAALIVLMEWVRTWLLTGFPWLFLGYSQIDGPLAGWAPIVGVFGLSFIIALSGAAIAQYMLDPSRNSLGVLLIMTAVWVSGFALKNVDWVTPQYDDQGKALTLKVSAIQANIPQEEKWRPENRLPTYRLYTDMTRQAFDKSDLIVWPETAVPRLYQRATRFLNSRSEEAKAHNVALITGIPYRGIDSATQKRLTYNSIVALGTADGLYHKRHLVPFGEYLPLDHYLRGAINFFNIPMSDFTAGDPVQVFLTAKSFKLAPFICYEVVYPSRLLEALPEADFLITISNDTWFGDSNGPLQHIEMARMRALEAGRQMIRSTNNGVTAFIDHRGQIISSVPQFEQTIAQAELSAMTGATPYSRMGYYPLLILCFISVLGLAWLSIKSHNSDA